MAVGNERFQSQTDSNKILFNLFLFQISKKIKFSHVNAKYIFISVFVTQKGLYFGS